VKRLTILKLLPSPEKKIVVSTRDYTFSNVPNSHPQLVVPKDISNPTVFLSNVRPSIVLIMGTYF
jgi:hypothetical protein